MKIFALAGAVALAVSGCAGVAQYQAARDAGQNPGDAAVAGLAASTSRAADYCAERAVYERALGDLAAATGSDTVAGLSASLDGFCGVVAGN